MAQRGFEFSAGSLALDFVDTVAGREGAPTDLLSGPATLTSWLYAAGIAFDAPVVVSPNALTRARNLREAIHRAARAVVAGEPPDDSDVAVINAAALLPDPRPQLIDGRVHQVARNPLTAALAAIAGEAIRTLSDAERHKLRRCPDCGMTFRDNSRPQSRVWCSSSSGCGNRAKVRRHRQRHGQS